MKDYLLMFFKTPFLYENSDKIMTSEAYHYILYPPQTSAEHGSYKVGFVNDWVFFDGKMAETLINHFKFPLCTPFKISKHSIIEPYIKDVENELKFKNNCYEMRISALITEMLIKLGRKYEFNNKNSHPAFSAIDSTRNFMLENIEKKLALKELAEHSNYSVSQFCALYSNFYKSSPMEDLLNARIEKAILLLKYNNTSIAETASLCGFSSIHYFSRKFKEKTGVAPSYYLKK